MKKFIFTLVCSTFLFCYNFNLVYADSYPPDFSDLAAKLSPSVVSISITMSNDPQAPGAPQFPPGSPFEDFFNEFFERRGAPPRERRQQPQQAMGSGFIIDSSGLIVTNNHVIDKAVSINVILTDNRSFKAKLIGKDQKTDLALIKIDVDEDLPTVTWGDSDKAKVGNWVLAIGNPFGLVNTVTAGIISARARDISVGPFDDFIQTDASINSGNSGGPLFNMKGEVVGINTAILGQSGSIGIGFAIPSNSAKLVIDQLLEFGETKRGWLGVRIQTVTKEIADVEKLKKARGALVASVAPGSPSDKAGIKDGDIILEFDGKKINEMQELPLIVAQTKVGKVVNVKVWRNKKEITKKITLGRLETSEDFKAEKPTKPKTTFIDGLKIEVRKITRDDLVEKKIPLNTTGVVITKIDTESPINYLKVGDLIVEAQKRNINTPGDLNIVVNSTLRSTEKNILIVIYNNKNQKRYIGVKLD